MILLLFVRSQLIDTVFAPLESGLRELDLSLSVVKRYLEPAIWQMITQKPDDWLPTGFNTWDELIISVYQESVEALLAKHSENKELADLQWGKVNRLVIKHPFSRQLPFLSRFLDMPTLVGFGDSFMPAVQQHSFGASQRFVVQPGLEEKGIMMLPGGQSGHIWTLPVSQGNTHLAKVFVTLVSLLTMTSRYVFID